MFRDASVFTKLTLLIELVPFVMAVAYAVLPTERNLSLMRPLSLGGLFAAIASGVLGLINVLRLAWMRELTPKTVQVMAVGTAESLVPLFVGFAALSAAWLLVAVGMGRQGRRM
jgi:hypothetical protein